MVALISLCLYHLVMIGKIQRVGPQKGHLGEVDLLISDILLGIKPLTRREVEVSAHCCGIVGS